MRGGFTHSFTYLRKMRFRCNITLSSWALDNRYLLLHFDGSENFRFSTHSNSNEWLLVDSSATIDVERYPLGDDILEFDQLVYTLTIRRRVGFYVYALLVPSVLLSFLMPLMFWIPTTGDGRITLGRLFRLSTSLSTSSSLLVAFIVSEPLVCVRAFLFLVCCFFIVCLVCLVFALYSDAYKCHWPWRCTWCFPVSNKSSSSSSGGLTWPRQCALLLGLRQ